MLIILFLLSKIRLSSYKIAIKYLLLSLSLYVISSENPNIDDIKSLTNKHSKTSKKSSKTLRQVEKVLQVASGQRSKIPLYSKTKKSENFSREKMWK